jgi:hypothetical protein
MVEPVLPTPRVEQVAGRPLRREERGWAVGQGGNARQFAANVLPIIEEIERAGSQSIYPQL